jgi:hypothetical protein
MPRNVAIKNIAPRLQIYRQGTALTGLKLCNFAQMPGRVLVNFVFIGQIRQIFLIRRQR